MVATLRDSNEVVRMSECLLAARDTVAQWSRAALHLTDSACAILVSSKWHRVLISRGTLSAYDFVISFHGRASSINQSSDNHMQETTVFAVSNGNVLDYAQREFARLSRHSIVAELFDRSTQCWHAMCQRAHIAHRRRGERQRVRTPSRHSGAHANDARVLLI
jgi:hypothetical protein